MKTDVDRPVFFCKISSGQMRHKKTTDVNFICNFENGAICDVKFCDFTYVQCFLHKAKWAMPSHKCPARSPCMSIHLFSNKMFNSEGVSSHSAIDLVT